MQIVSIGDNLREMSDPVLWKKSAKIFQNVCWNVYAVLSVKEEYLYLMTILG